MRAGQRPSKAGWLAGVGNCICSVLDRRPPSAGFQRLPRFFHLLARLPLGLQLVLPTEGLYVFLVQLGNLRMAFRLGPPVCNATFLLKEDVLSRDL